MAYTLGIAAALMAFQYVPAGAAALQWFNVFMIGFFLYGPQMLIGLCGAELVGPDSVGASEGFLGWIAYLGTPWVLCPVALVALVALLVSLRDSSRPALRLAFNRGMGRDVLAAIAACVLLPPGAANAGIPLSIIVKEYGWAAYFNTLVCACFLALLLLSPMVNLRSYVQRRERFRQRKLKEGGQE